MYKATVETVSKGVACVCARGLAEENQERLDVALACVDLVHAALLLGNRIKFYK